MYRVTYLLPIFKYSMKKQGLLLCLLFISLFQLVHSSETLSHFQHFSTKDGLPQYTIMDMLQDKKGFMWFATWDGLSKFDGYKFQNYKVQSGDNYIMKSNRIEKIYEDKYNRIWMLSYDGEAHSFNPKTEKFWGLQSVEKFLNMSFSLSKISIQPSGKVWLLSDKSGCIVITDSLYNTAVFNSENSSLKDNLVHSVFEDKNLNSWILTDKGLSILPKGMSKTVSYSFVTDKNKPQQNSFYSAFEFEKEIWFGVNEGRILRYSKLDRKFKLLKLPVNSEIKQILQAKNHQVIFITSQDGFVVLNSGNNKFKIFNSINLPQLKSNKIVSGSLDQMNRLWLETGAVGIYKFDLNTEKIKYYFVKTDDLSTSIFPPPIILLDDVNGKTWIQPKGGGFSLFNPATDNLEPFMLLKNKPELKFSNILHSAYTDRQGNLWFCTRSHGLEKITFDRSIFNPLVINKIEKTTVSNDVRAVFEDLDHNLWVSTKDRKLTLFDTNKNLIGRLSGEGKVLPDAFFKAVVYSITQDNEGNIWVGTRGDGLFKIRKTKNKRQFSIMHFQKDPTDVFSLSDNSVYSIFQDKKGNIWVGTYGGGLNLVKFTPEGKTYFINHRNNLKNYPIDSANRVRFITEDNRGHICVGSTGGLMIFSTGFTNPENIVFKLYSRIKGMKESLSSNDVHNICITQDNEMYIATFGGGINKVVEYDKNGLPLLFKQYMSKSGLPSDITLSILEDKDKKLWISSENNLTKFDTEKVVFETFAEINRLMSVNNFSEASTCKTSKNELIFGYSNGILIFSPEKIERNLFKPNISFSNFLLFNKDVIIGNNSPLTSSIDNISNLELTHKQKYFSIEYAALDFVDPENILYAYKMEGLDEDWNYVQKQRVANYTNLPKGKYVFRVKSTNSEGVWVENERRLPIEVLPSFWETPYAYFLYFSIFVLLVMLSVYILITIYQLKANMKLEKEISEMKLRFFTDISHEIRTPLTMITAPVEFLLNDGNTPDPVKKHLKMISQNTNRMLRLVNQILDFRKIQFMHLKVVETEVAPFIEEICDNFRETADTQHINFNFINQTSGAKIWVDPDCLEKIVMNLLSNAFKFTPSGKSIQVAVKEEAKFLSIEVRDQGTGVTKEKQKRLFTRFASFNVDKSKPSTGIGLSLVKDLAEKHGAKVSVESEEGKGSTFTVSFLYGVEHFGKNVEIIVASSSEPLLMDGIQTEGVLLQAEPNEENPKLSNKSSVLIVEDDSDLRSFIKSILENDYTIYESEDGVDGLEKATRFFPDFVVSDIMMPRMDGIELLQSLKKNIITSHIPVILLTAKTTIESKLEGLAYGADDYITKPFSVQYFKARIANLIQQRKLLQEIFRKNLITHNTSEFNPQPLAISVHDNEIMQRVMQFIEENMENSELTVEELGQFIGMSRSVFFNKIKSLTGLSPVEFIRDVKMKRAAQILVSGQYMVKEVSYLVGISDTKYFAKCFKAKFGVTPLEYKNQKVD